MKDTRQKNKVSQEKLFETIVTEASGFYRSVLTVATAFLGGTLVFLKQMAPSPSPLSQAALGLGWFALIASVGCVIWVRRLNLDSGRHVLEGDIEAARRLDRRTRTLSNWAAGLLVAGMILLMLFGFLNLSTPT